MDGRIDPPSSMNRLTSKSVVKQMEDEILLVINHQSRPIACAFVTELSDAFYIGKLAVDEGHRNRGASTAILKWVENLSRDTGEYKPLRLQTRIELTENHAIFAHHGFVKTEEGRHPGFDRTTEITMEKPV
jgi:GNAT superfamily N-acetyltransferase